MFNEDEIFEMWVLAIRAKHNLILHREYEKALYTTEVVKVKPLPSWFKK